MPGGVAQAVRELETGWGLQHHTAVHLLRLISHVATRPTSGRRTAAQNAAVGGARRSHHLSGRAIDVVVARRDWRHAVEYLRADRCGSDCRGTVELLDERDHIHAAW